MFDHPYKVFENAVEARVCDVLAELSQSLKLMPGTIGPQQGAENVDYRNSIVGFFPPEHWVTGIVYHFAAIANAGCWQFNLTAPTPVQYTEYGEAQHYDWHMDMGGDPPNAVTTRKLTAILQLTDGSDFDGGDLEMKLSWDNRDERVVQIDAMRKKGSVIVFPSFMPHRVRPVTSGIRRTLVCWIIGPRFR